MTAYGLAGVFIFILISFWHFYALKLYFLIGGDFLEYTQRTRMVVGDDNFEKVTDKKICVVGVGGVGGAALEGLVRFGFKNIAIFDFDTVDITNLNRQIISTRDAVGRPKTEVAAERAKSINPDINITLHNVFIEKDNLHLIKDEKPAYVIDAIDSVKAKLDLIEFCHKENIPYNEEGILIYRVE